MLSGSKNAFFFKTEILNQRSRAVIIKVNHPINTDSGLLTNWLLLFYNFNETVTTNLLLYRSQSTSLHIIRDFYKNFQIHQYYL